MKSELYTNEPMENVLITFNQKSISLSTEMPVQDMLVHAYRSFIEPVDLANYELILCDGTLLQWKS